MTPDRVWVFYPHNGNAPVLWTEPCPFPHEDEAECVEYVRAIPAEGDVATLIANLRTPFNTWRSHDAQERLQDANRQRSKAADALDRLSRRVAELEGERDSLIAAIADHVTVRGEYYARATAAEARAAELEAQLCK